MTPVEFRRHLHTHPELSFEEYDTAAFISQALAKEGIEHRTIAGTGILAWIEGEGDLRDAVVLRADIDALPVEEQTSLEYASQNKGVMHACGHDIHAAVLYGVLCRLNHDRNFHGTIFGLFQPGEECNPGGASLVLAENPFEGYNIRAVVGEHVEPQLEVGTMGMREGKYMASNDELRFSVTGRGGHAAMRQALVDPIAAAAELIGRLICLNDDESVVSIGKVEAAGATNVIPDKVYMEGTMRTFNPEVRTALHSHIAELAAAVDSHHKTTTTVDINHGYPCVVNDPGLVATARRVAAAAGVKVEELRLRPTSEDFGFYCERYPSIFYRLGVGTAAGRTHTATFAPDERAIDFGIGFMERLAREFSQQ